MPVIDFVAPVIRAAITTLQAELPDQIDLFNADTQNGVTLAAPDDANYVFGAQDPLGVAGFPVIEVAATQGSGGLASVGLGDMGSDFDHFPIVNVVVWHEGDRGEVPTTYEMSLGLAKCVVEVLLQREAFGSNVSPIADENGRLAFFWRSGGMPADLSDDGRSFTKWRVPVFLQFTVQQVDSFHAP